jgi:hypothetical protein
MTALEQLKRTIQLCRDYVVAQLSDDEICRSFQSLRVLCVSDSRNLSCHGGQTALVTTACLLSRMGMQVGLGIPDVPMLLPQPPLAGASLRDALIASSGKLVSGATVCFTEDFNPDLIFALGDTSIAESPTPTWRLSGGAWHGALAMEDMVEARVWMTDWPIGAMVSAALAGAEAFKFVMRRLPLANRAHQIFLEPSRVCNLDFGPVNVSAQGVALGEVDLISAGAICQATLYALVRLPRVQMWGRIFDDDVTVESNLNRNMLTLIGDVGSFKVHTVAGRCGPNLKLEPMNTRFVGESSSIKLARRVLVGVDDIPSRWAVQRYAPEWLAVGGTTHFNVSSSDHAPGEPCSGCLHFVDDPANANPIPTASFISFLAGLAMAVRLVRQGVGAPYPRNQQHLWLSPLRMDHPHVPIWFPVAVPRSCPVGCVRSELACAPRV